MNEKKTKGLREGKKRARNEGTASTTVCFYSVQVSADTIYCSKSSQNQFYYLGLDASEGVYIILLLAVLRL